MAAFYLMYVCLFVSKVLLISSAAVIVRAGGAIWLYPFSTVLFSVYSAVTVECSVLNPCLHGCVWYVCYNVGKNALLQCLCNYCEEGYEPV